MSKLYEGTSADDQNAPAAGRVAAAAIHAANDFATGLAVDITDLVVILRLADAPEGEERNAVLGFPPDPMHVVSQCFSAGVRMLEAISGTKVSLDLLPAEARQRVRAMRSGDQRPAGRRGQRRGR